MNATLASDPVVRRRGIGGSDIAAVVGIDPWGRTAYDVWLEKIGEAPPREEMDERVHWGNILEEPVAQEMARRLEKRIARVNRTLVHRDHPFLIGHIDRKVIGERAALEVKTTSLWMAGNWSSDSPDDIPVHIQYQVQHYMEVADLERVYVGVLIGGQMLKMFTVERDRAMGEAIVDVCVAFWNDYVRPEIAPPPTSIEEVRRRFPQHVGLPVEATTEAEEALELLVQAKSRIKAAEADEKTAQDALASYLSECDTLTIGGKPALTFRTVVSNRLDGKLLAADHPDLHAAYVRPSSTRVMRLVKGSK